MKKNGFSLLGYLILIVLTLVFIAYAIKIGSIFLEQRTVQNIVKTAIQKEKNNSDSTDPKRDITDSILTQVSLTNLPITKNDIIITKSKNELLITIPLIKEIKITQKIKVVFDLTVEEEYINN
jgi:hypothetical protein